MIAFEYCTTIKEDVCRKLGNYRHEYRGKDKYLGSRSSEITTVDILCWFIPDTGTTGGEKPFIQEGARNVVLSSVWSHFDFSYYHQHFSCHPIFLKDMILNGRIM